jgi:hypothetical protein
MIDQRVSGQGSTTGPHEDAALAFTVEASCDM